MKNIHIKEKLKELDIDLNEIVLGDFDQIGEFTAKRNRSPDDENYKKFGAFYRANYERGILVYHLIRQFKLTSLLEIGFGRGYTTFCAAKAFYDAGIVGKVVSIDPNVDENFLKALSSVFPKQWFEHIQIMKGTSKDVIPHIPENFDMIYVDGDHSYEGTKIDWELTKEKFNKFLLFDDYHLPTKIDKGTIECSKLIDEVDWKSVNCKEPELLFLDRRLFIDDRSTSDADLDYGQVLLTKNDVVAPNGDW